MPTNNLDGTFEASTVYASDSQLGYHGPRTWLVIPRRV